MSMLRAACIRQNMQQHYGICIASKVNEEVNITTISSHRYNRRARAIIQKFREETGAKRAYPPVYSGYQVGRIS